MPNAALSREPQLFQQSTRTEKPSRAIDFRFRLRETVMTDSDLPAKARVIFAILDESARGKESCVLGQDTLVRRSGFPERTVQRCVSQLRAAGYIETVRREEFHSRNEYRLVRSALPPTPAKITPLPPPMAAPLPPPMAGRSVSVLITEEREEIQLTVSEFRELEDAFDRHLKHHRTEDRDNVLRVLMDQAQRGAFGWDKFRDRHTAWCAAQARIGWQYATITFLGWVRAGMPPPAPQIASGQSEGATARSIRVAKERVMRKGRL